jgi:glyoxylase-like metal-dependent hydrolase (beta-lactamase superfamily II)
MGRQIQIDETAIVFDRRLRKDGTRQVAPDLAYLRLGIVNVTFSGDPDDPGRPWVLVDAGLLGSASAIMRAARRRFGNRRPDAIILTHGHFDHVGALLPLAKAWQVPVYAHELEHPYLDGSASYPPPDPSVGGGLIAALSAFFPAGPVDASPYLRPLPADGTVPHMPGWRWLHTPGHSAGHVSLFRDRDRALIAGDAVITTRQESAYAVAVQRAELHGPPMYFTPDWDQARASVRMLADLEPSLLVPGHGRAMTGQWMRLALHRLADAFDRIARPARGHYLRSPSNAADGSAYRPP